MKANEKTFAVGGLAGWLLSRLRARGRRQPRLELVERIALAPRQSLALVEAEGRRFLVATSPEGAPAFYALDERARPAVNGVAQVSSTARSTTRLAARVSW
jgi:flagellar biogenesis protein FliO